MQQIWRWALLTAVFALAGAMFFTGITWGLPSSAADPFLFGDRRPWTGQQIISLAGNWDDSNDRGADIAMHPLAGRDQPITVNATDPQRAEIVRRYRLYSAQPDEMITFRALSRMKPSHGHFDPHFFQYGGLWVYPVGLLLKLASIAHLITLRPDLAYYLDHPAQFAKFYIVARAYSAGWGLVGVAVVFAIGKAWSGRFSTGIAAAILYATLPVVVNMAHEAKPHLPGAVLTLLAMLAAIRFMQTGRTCWWVLAGIASGAAFSMVLTGVVSFMVLPMMVLARPMQWNRRINIVLSAGAIGFAIFLASNPYLPIDLLSHRNIVQSNVGNYGNFYKPSLSVAGLKNAAQLIAEGMTLPAAIVAGLAVITLIFAGRSRRGPGWILAAPALLVAIQFVLLASGKRAEYARFALTLDVVLAITAAVALSAVRNVPILPKLAMLLMLCGTSLAAFHYVRNFKSDVTSSGLRWSAAKLLAGFPPGSVLAVSAEPAPYCLPPVDLFRWKIVLLPPGTQANQFDLAWSVVNLRAADYPEISLSVRPPSRELSPISWANKPFEINLYRSSVVGP